MSPAALPQKQKAAPRGGFASICPSMQGSSRRNARRGLQAHLGEGVFPWSARPACRHRSAPPVRSAGQRLGLAGVHPVARGATELTNGRLPKPAGNFGHAGVGRFRATLGRSRCRRCGLPTRTGSPCPVSGSPPIAPNVTVRPGRLLTPSPGLLCRSVCARCAGAPCYELPGPGPLFPP